MQQTPNAQILVNNECEKPLKSSLNVPSNSSSSAPLLVTTGEPAGIGMDIILQQAVQGSLTTLNRAVVVLADEEALIQRANSLYGSDFHKLHDGLWSRIATADELMSLGGEALNESTLFNQLSSQLNEPITENDPLSQRPQFYLIQVDCPSPVVAGELNVENAGMVISQLELAHKLAYAGCVSAIITGPLQKSILIDAGLTLADGTIFTGHTEFFMQQSGSDKVVMMLANTAMKVALVTTHLPLREVADAITSDSVRQTVQIVLDDMRVKFGLDNPRILVCGLNPHAGEGGHLGHEEIDIINPVLKAFQDQGVNISSAMPADTLFTPRHLQDCDVVIAMFHDQGLPVLKSHGFGDTVNLTLGLPYIRTSVDHGTALDLAGQSIINDAENNLTSAKASSSSLWQALTMADEMVASISRSSL